jgi:DNA-binding transcriptional MerR regulator
MAATEPDTNQPMPKKAYYSIREVCSQTGLEPHVLRYWESEFPQLRPKKNRAGNRAYREKDIETVLYIKHLLYEEKYTIPGAKKKLAEMRELDQPLTPPPADSADEPAAAQPPAPAASSVDTARRQEVLQELRQVLDILRPQG